MINNKSDNYPDELTLSLPPGITYGEAGCKTPTG